MSLRLQAGWLLLAAILFAGCGQRNEPAPPATTTPPSSQADPAPADNQVAGDPRPADDPMPPSIEHSTPATQQPAAEDKPPATESVARPEVKPETKPDEEPIEAPAFPSPDKIAKVENDPPVPQREERKPMEAPPEAKGLVRVTPNHDIWLDGKNKRVVLGAKVVLREGPLELFCTLAEQKEHEAVVSVLTEAYFVHAALVSFGFDPGHPVQFRPEYKPAEGPEIEITVHWTDENGKRQSARAQDWVRNTKTGKPLEYPWVFGGSGLWMDEATGQSHYLAEGGDFICVSNFPSAMIDLPIRSTDTNAALLYEAFTEHIPARGTEVALVLTPKPGKKPAADQAADDGPVEAPAAQDEAAASGEVRPANPGTAAGDDAPVAAPPVE